MRLAKYHFTLLSIILVAVFATPSATAEKFYQGAHEYTVLPDGKTVSARLRTDFFPNVTGELYFPGIVTNEGKEYTVTEILTGGYASCTSVTSLTIPNTVVTIGERAFQGCVALRDLTIGNSVATIGPIAFNKCSNLSRITIPRSVETIGDNAFLECSKLEEIKVEQGNIRYDSRDDCHALIETASNRLLCGTKNTIIPNTVKEIGDNAFYSCEGLTDIIIPNSVTTIGNCAFFGCSGLAGIEIPGSVTAIGIGAFSSCDGLTSMALPNSVTSLGHSVFSDSRGLKSVTLPDAITQIKANTFKGCRSLTSVTFPESITAIGEMAFYECQSLPSFTIPDKVVTIGNAAFMGCFGMASVTIGKSVTSIVSNVFSNCTSLKSVVIPDQVTVVDYNAFGRCTGLESVRVGNSVTSIGQNAFNGCDHLTSIILPCSVTSYGENAFNGCDNLEELTITGVGNFVKPAVKSSFPADKIKTLNVGSGVTGLGNLKFNPTTVNSYAIVPPTCGTSTFAGYNGALHVPTTALSAYFSAPHWENFGSLKAYLSDKLSLNQTTATLMQWDELQLTATATPQGSALTWRTTDAGVAAVDATGKVLAVAAGTCDIMVNLTANPAVYAFCHVMVSYPEIAITLDKETVTLDRIGEQVTLVATVTPDGTGLTPTWKSSDQSVATVDAGGTVIAVGQGECDITASVQGKSATCHIVVLKNAIITLPAEELTVSLNTIVTLTPMFDPEPTEIVATSSDPSVAIARIIDAPSNGAAHTPVAGTKIFQVLGVKEGTATITVASADGLSVPATLAVTVIDHFPEGDVNCDRTVNGSDVTALYNALLGESGGPAGMPAIYTTHLDGTPVLDGDVNGDGIVNGSDVTALYNLLLN